MASGKKATVKKLAAAGRSDGQLRVVGKALRKVDATAKVTGATRFADDLFLPRMLYAKLLRSPHAHALITGIDTSRAQALPGVKAVLTGKDLPIPFGILPVSQDEHTSELQSHHDLVCRLLLEKKKKERQRAPTSPNANH